MTVGQTLRKAREKLGKTQRQIAEDLGKTQPCIQEWESDKALPRTAELRVIAKIYGVPLERLIPGRAA